MFSPKAAIGALMLLACTASARLLLQNGVPPQCIEGSMWDDDDIGCDFVCPSGRYELDCDIDNGALRCKVDKDNSPGSQDVYFTCPLPSSSHSPDCSQGIQSLSSNSDTCISSTVSAVLAAWKPSAAGTNGDTNGNTVGTSAVNLNTLLEQPRSNDDLDDRIDDRFDDNDNGFDDNDD